MTKEEAAKIEEWLTVEVVGGDRVITFKTNPSIMLREQAMYADEARMRVLLAMYLRRIAQYLEV